MVKKKTNYELLCELESLDIYNSLLTSGIVPINWVDYKTIFEFHELELSNLKKQKHNCKSIARQAKENTANEFNISERMVYFIINLMQK